MTDPGPDLYLLKKKGNLFWIVNSKYYINKRILLLDYSYLGNSIMSPKPSSGPPTVDHTVLLHRFCKVYPPL